MFMSTTNNNNSNERRSGQRASDMSKSESRIGVGNSRSRKKTNKNQAGYARRKSGIKSSTRRVKPPQWEREGDALYYEHQATLPSSRQSSHAGMTIQQARQQLKTLSNRTFISSIENSILPSLASTTATNNGTSPADAPESSSSTVHWGTLPVGPILSSHLIELGWAQPTPIQTAAFSILQKYKPLNQNKYNNNRNSGGGGKNYFNPSTSTNNLNPNVILAAPTGTGKSVAYLLPLLTSERKRYPCSILLVTPTTELAYQLQQEVHRIWSLSSSLLHVVCPMTSANDGTASNGNDTTDTDDNAEVDVLSAIPPEAVILAGTPKILRTLLRQVAAFNGQLTQNSSVVVDAIRSNLQTIVLDEADRLLRTEIVARFEIAKREQKARLFALEQQSQPSINAQPRKMTKLPSSNVPKLERPKPTQTQKLLWELPQQLSTTARSKPRPPSRSSGRPTTFQSSAFSSSSSRQSSLSAFQLICVSATVGRTLRRQMMHLIDASSIDKAATLVTGETDARTNYKLSPAERQSSLLPSSLRHFYYLLEPTPNSKLSTKEDQTVDGLWKVLEWIAHLEEQTNLPSYNGKVANESMKAPKSILIFPGRLGLEFVREGLLTRSNGRLSHASIQTIPSIKTIDKPKIATTTSLEDPPPELLPFHITIVRDKMARGLDLPGLHYVLLVAPPSSPAGYTHLAGRTGRQGRPGAVVTLVRPNESFKLISLSQALGNLEWNEVSSST